ncbi:MAG: urea transporter [Planctomycetes bacterium]|nr:urea transporter [Planctomycetota bacterium]
MTVKNFIEAFLKGNSQVFLIENVITGIFFLGGVFYHSRCLGMGAVFGALVGTGLALLLRYKSDDIRQGLYGYNSTLVCLAIFYFFGLTIPSLIASFLGAILSVLRLLLSYQPGLSCRYSRGSVLRHYKQPPYPLQIRYQWFPP